MPKFNPYIRKRIPLTITTMLAGVALAGVLSCFIETPQGQNDYLHEHLASFPRSTETVWAASSQPLPPKDRLEIERLIVQADVEQFSRRDDTEASDTSIRIDRRLREAHMNGDYRVVSIEDIGLRVDFNVNVNGADLALRRASTETRILQFYQTQSGWVQGAKTTLTATEPLPQRAEAKFKDVFSSKLIGLNYYPASASWKDFWRKFPINNIEFDLDKSKELNVNALRIFLTHDYFDNAETRGEALVKLQKFLDICQERDIKVLVTLFDLRPDYTVSNWDADVRHIDRVLQAIAAHEALLGVDLKNQADLDFEAWGAGHVEAWLTVMARRIQSQYAGVAVTAGWSRPDNALRLQNVFDVVTYHEYGHPNLLGERLNEIISGAKGKPVMITEIGSTIWRPPFVTRIGETAQASRLQAQLSQASTANGVFIWTLNDFQHVGKDVVGPLPWRQAQQRHFGILRSDGSYRPAAQVLKTFGAQDETELTQSSFLITKAHSTF